MKIKNQRAFTLIEMIMVIVIMAIVATILGPFLSQPFVAYQALSQRAELVNMLNSTMDQMARDIAQAVPNSVRESGTVMEMMNTQAYGRYRYSNTYNQDINGNPTSDNDDTALAPTLPDASFNVLGDIAAGIAAGSRAIVNNVDVNNLYVNAVSGASVITPAINSATDLGAETRIVLAASFTFDRIGTGSPSNRVYFSDGPVLYRCTGANANGAGQIRRYTGYAVTQNIPVAVPPNSITDSLVVDHVSQCSFTYDNNTATRSGLVTLNIQLTIGNQSVRLIQQVQVANAP